MGGSILAQVLNQPGGEVPDLDDPQDLVNLVERGQRTARAGPHPGVPRPQRRRPVRRGLRDGLCRPRGRRAERRPAGHRGRRHQRQPRRIRRRQELGGAGQRAARGADAQGAVQRGTRRAAAGAHGGAQRGDAGAAHARPVQAQPLRRQDPAGEPRRSTSARARCRSGATPRRCSAPSCRPAPGVGQRQLEDLPAARQPGVRGQRACGGGGPERSRPACFPAGGAPHPNPLPGGGGREQDRAALFLNLSSAQASPSCASRASTRTSRWPTPSPKPASRRSTCT
jgi:hypothetical protein